MDKEIQRFYPLGTRTLVMLILKRSAIIFLLLFIMLGGLFYLQYVPAQYVDVALYVFIAYAMAFIIFAVIAFFLGWLEYIRYEITIGDQSLKMQRGLINVEQVGIPYRHIQDIKIERSLLDQIVGVSEIMVTITGPEQQEIHPGEGTGGQPYRIMLPAIDKRIARQIQEIVLSRAQVLQYRVSDKA